jgi:hypothetical protein
MEEGLSDFQLETNKKISKINSAADINARLQKMWNNAFEAGKVKDYNLWNYILDSLWEEVISPLEQNKADEAKKLQGEMDTINQKLYEAQGIIKAPLSQFDSKPKEYLLQLAKQYIILRQKSRLIKRVQNIAGMGIAQHSDDDDDIDS